MINNDHPLLKKQKQVIPGTRVRLPSRAKFYKNGELVPECLSDGEITLYPMTTQDDIIMRHPDSLLQGTAVELVIKRCCPDILIPEALFGGDVEYILTQLRLISYGDTIQVTSRCPNFKPTEEVLYGEEYEYRLSINDFIRGGKEIDDTGLDIYTLTLSSGIVVNLKPITYKDTIKSFQDEVTLQTTFAADSSNTEKYLSEQNKIVLNSVAMHIDDVDGETNRDIIYKWLEMLPVNDTLKIIKKYSKINNFGPNFKKTIKCKGCHEKHDISYLINPVNFFMQPADLETENNSIN